MTKLPTSQLLALVQSLLPTNHNEEIEALDVRTVLDDVIDTLTQENVTQVLITPYTVLDSSRGDLLVINRVPATSILLPQPSAGGFFIAGWSTEFVNLGTGLVTITPQGGATINGGATATLAQNQALLVSTDGLNYYGIKTALSPSPTISIELIIDGGGSAITTGIKGDLEIPFACTLVQNTVLADQVGSIVIDIWKDTYAAFPPTNADSICAAAKPTIAAAIKSQDTTLVGWTVAISAGDILRFNVDSVTSIQRVTISLSATKA